MYSFRFPVLVQNEQYIVCGIQHTMQQCSKFAINERVLNITDEVKTINRSVVLNINKLIIIFQ